MEDVTIDGELALRLLNLLDELCDGGFLASYAEDGIDVRAEAAALGSRLLDQIPRPFGVGDRVVPVARLAAAPGTVVHQVLFSDGWEVHVEWPDEGVGISRASGLACADPEAR